MSNKTLKQNNVHITHPKIGEVILIHKVKETTNWWNMNK
jgi:hypothetical protein